MTITNFSSFLVMISNFWPMPGSSLSLIFTGIPP
jgi:hypothetical protein